MAQIRVRTKLGTFRLRKQNDKGAADEPYLLTLFAKLDSPLGDLSVPIAQKTIPIHFPEGLGHGDLGPNSKAMSVAGVNHVPVPSGIGEWTTTLDSSHLDFTFTGMRNCAVGFAVVFVEEDSTLDSSVEAMLPELKKEVRKRANGFLRFVLGQDPVLPTNFPGGAALLAALHEYREELRRGGIDVNGIIDGGALMDHVLAAVLPGEVGKAIGKVLIPGGELWNLIAAAVQAGDADEYIGAGGRMCSFFDLVGLAHAPIEFSFDTARTVTLEWPTPPGFDPPTFTDTSKGLYEIDGTLDRTDTDEPPIVAALRGPDDVVVAFARRLDGDGLERLRSTDFGKTYTAQVSGDFFKGAFKSGPSASNSADRKTWCVAGLGLDDEVRFAISQNAGGTWSAWTRVSKRKTFVGSPAVTLNAAGTAIYLVARDTSHFYWFTESKDLGKTWEDWQRIGSGVFHSSPAMVRVARPLTRPPVPDILVVAGLGTDKRVWFSRFSTNANLANEGWQPIATGSDASARFTSAPTMVSDGKDEIVLVCRANDLRYWRVGSFDGGKQFKVGTTWLPLGRPDRGRVRYTDEGERRGDLQRMFSAPALVASDDMETRVMFGLTPTLALWRNRHTRHENAAWRGTKPEPEIDLRPFYY